MREQSQPLLHRYFYWALGMYGVAIITLMLTFSLFWYFVKLPLILYHAAQGALVLALAAWVCYYRKSKGKTAQEGRFRTRLIPLLMVACFFIVYIGGNYCSGMWNKLDKLRTVRDAHNGIQLEKSVGMAGLPGREDVLIIELPLLLTVDITHGYLYSEDELFEVEGAMLHCVSNAQRIRGNWYKAELAYCG